MEEVKRDLDNPEYSTSLPHLPDKSYLRDVQERIHSPYSGTRRRPQTSNNNVDQKDMKSDGNQVITPRLRPATAIGDRLVRNDNKPPYQTISIPTRSRPVTANRAVSTASQKLPLGSLNKVFVLPSQIIAQPPKPTVDIRNMGTQYTELVHFHMPKLVSLTLSHALPCILSHYLNRC